MQRTGGPRSSGRHPRLEVGGGGLARGHGVVGCILLAEGGGSRGAAGVAGVAGVARPGGATPGAGLRSAAGRGCAPRRRCGVLSAIRLTLAGPSSAQRFGADSPKRFVEAHGGHRVPLPAAAVVHAGLPVFSPRAGDALGDAALGEGQHGGAHPGEPVRLHEGLRRGGLPVAAARPQPGAGQAEHGLLQQHPGAPRPRPRAWLPGARGAALVWRQEQLRGHFRRGPACADRLAVGARRGALRASAGSPRLATASEDGAGGREGRARAVPGKFARVA
mmetsp:Transcript_10595/g.28987  ORF Transcript_10595/g.28987 Transcript_10595/m.28987 type:complete len:276 (-) Transcript_10595:277-1104(-)